MCKRASNHPTDIQRNVWNRLWHSFNSSLRWCNLPSPSLLLRWEHTTNSITVLSKLSHKFIFSCFYHKNHVTVSVNFCFVFFCVKLSVFEGRYFFVMCRYTSFLPFLFQAVSTHTLSTHTIVMKNTKLALMCNMANIIYLNHTNIAWTYVFICAMKGVRLIGGETVFEFPEQSWGFWFGLAEPWVVCGAAYGPLISQSFHHTTHRGLSSYLHLLPFSCFTKHRKRKFRVAISWLRLRHYRTSRCVHRLFTLNLCENDWLDIVRGFSSFKSIWKTKLFTGSLKSCDDAGLISFKRP